MPSQVKVTVVADRGFGDCKLFKTIAQELGFAYVIRIRGDIYVTSAKGERRKAAQWVGQGGRSRTLRGAQVTDEHHLEVGRVVCVHDRKMKEPWCLVASESTVGTRTLIRYYGKRWGIETSFRDIKDMRFGMGLSARRVSSPQRRDRMLLLSALAIALLSLLGGAGESLGYDRFDQVNTAKYRTATRCFVRTSVDVRMTIFPDKRRDCERVVIALMVTPDGFPLAYEVMAGNTSDNTTLADFLTKIEDQYGRSDRVWIMDRGIPTEETLEAMREGDTPVRYLVGTPKGRLTRLEKSFLEIPWQEVRQSVDVKLLTNDGELFVLVRSERRVLKERSMRRRRLKKLWKRLGELRRQSNRRDTLMLKLGAAKKDAGRAWFLVEVDVPNTDEELAAHGLTYRLRRKKLRQVFRREGRYLLRSNMTGEDPAALWRHYMQLTEIEQAFKELKHNLAIRPIFHQLEQRIEAHIFVSFIAYCLLVTLKNLARPQAPGLTPRAIVEKFAAIQMVDLHVPTADGRHLVLARHTQPSEDHELLLRQLDSALPKQPAPKLLS